MFSKEYIQTLSVKTGFAAESLQKQMTLLDILREIGRHPYLKNKFALKGGTAINFFWFQLPRLSVDVDLNYIGSNERETMLLDRPMIEEALSKLIESRGISVLHAPADEHAGAKWRLRAPSSFGGNFTLELDLNYIMRIPVYGIYLKQTYPLEENYTFHFASVSFEELLGGKIKALMERSATRDLFDVFMLSNTNIEYDFEKLKAITILFGVTSNRDWRNQDLHTIDEIDQKMIDEELRPLLRQDEELDIDTMKTEVKNFISRIFTYEENEMKFMIDFLDHGDYKPELLFGQTEQARILKYHPAVQWKLQNLRRFRGLDKE